MAGQEPARIRANCQDGKCHGRNPVAAANPLRLALHLIDAQECGYIRRDEANLIHLNEINITHSGEIAALVQARRWDKPTRV